jgi:hypothetical protein
MQFNDFQRMLRDANLSEKAQYLLTHMFEVQVEMSRSLDLTLGLMEQLTNRMQDVANINDDLFLRVKELQRRGMPDGVDVHSVRNEPEN